MQMLIFFCVFDSAGFILCTYCMAHEAFMPLCVFHIRWTACAVCVYGSGAVLPRNLICVYSFRLWKLYLCDPETQTGEQAPLCLSWKVLRPHKRFDRETGWLVWKINESHSFTSVDVLETEHTFAVVHYVYFDYVVFWMWPLCNFGGDLWE